MGKELGEDTDTVSSSVQVFLTRVCQPTGTPQWDRKYQPIWSSLALAKVLQSALPDLIRGFAMSKVCDRPLKVLNALMRDVQVVLPDGTVDQRTCLFCRS